MFIAPLISLVKSGPNLSDEDQASLILDKYVPYQHEILKSPSGGFSFAVYFGLIDAHPYTSVTLSNARSPKNTLEQRSTKRLFQNSFGFLNQRVSQQFI